MTTPARTYTTLRDSILRQPDLISKVRSPALEKQAPAVWRTCKVYNRQVFSERPYDRDHAMAVYEAHRQEVITIVLTDWPLVHELGDGWEPLFRHLAVPVPDQP